MRRILVWMSFLVVVLVAVSVETVWAQGGTSEGFPPQTFLFNDTLLLARALPFVVALAIGFGIWQGKVGLRQPKSSPNSRSVIRHDFGTVIAHWTNGIGFIIALITGLMVLRWLPRPDEMRIVFALHYVGVVLIMFGVVAHLTQNAITGGMGLVPRSLKDVGEGLSEIVEYSGIFGSHRAALGIKLPKAIRQTFAETATAFGIKPTKKLGKFLPVERVFSYTPWAIIVAVVVITGLIKSLRYLYPIPASIIAPVTTVHDIFSYVAVGMLAIHLAALLLVPANWPLLISMFTTRVSRKHVQEHHPLWYKDLVAKEQAIVDDVTPVSTTQGTPQRIEETQA
ncbi:MAG: cytochrome b/b6 domain-containing protein [Chloroflexi bacterium]|nr:cytochrome b/b6 domain-containing protein [Chloroflexota bacterium]